MWRNIHHPTRKFSDVTIWKVSDVSIFPIMNDWTDFILPFKGSFVVAIRDLNMFVYYFFFFSPFFRSFLAFFLLFFCSLLPLSSKQKEMVKELDNYFESFGQLSSPHADTHSLIAGNSPAGSKKRVRKSVKKNTNVEMSKSERRKAQNRLAAQRSRDKKKEASETLQEIVDRLQSERTDFLEIIAELEEENRVLRAGAALKGSLPQAQEEEEDNEQDVNSSQPSLTAPSSPSSSVASYGSDQLELSSNTSTTSESAAFESQQRTVADMLMSNFLSQSPRALAAQQANAIVVWLMASLPLLLLPFSQKNPTISVPPLSPQQRLLTSMLSTAVCNAVKDSLSPDFSPLDRRKRRKLCEPPSDLPPSTSCALDPSEKSNLTRSNASLSVEEPVLSVSSPSPRPRPTTSVASCTPQPPPLSHPPWGSFAPILRACPV